jgi:hypothetical protein
VLYQISPALLPVAHDLGFVFFKLGEEAICDLDAFDLKGNKAKAQRHAINAMEKAGAVSGSCRGTSFARSCRRSPRSPTHGSRARGRPRRVLAGRFDVDYLLRFPCAIVESGDGAWWPSRTCSKPASRGGVDRPDAPRGTSRVRPSQPDGVPDLEADVRREGARLPPVQSGHGPLAAVGATRRARPMERLAHQFFLHGEAWYNYQGLRRFKERFHPAWEPRYLAYRGRGTGRSRSPRHTAHFRTMAGAPPRERTDGVKRLLFLLPVLPLLLAAAPSVTVEETKSLPGSATSSSTGRAISRSARGVVLFVSGTAAGSSGSWTWRAASTIARSSRAVDAGVAEARGEQAGRCWYPPASSRSRPRHSRSLRLPRYVPPILVGYSSGATVVYGALAASAADDLRGAVSLGFCPDLEVKRPICGTTTWKPGGTRRRSRAGSRGYPDVASAKEADPSGSRSKA